MISDVSFYEPCEAGMIWGVGCILIDDDTILLGRRTDNNLWGSPGGGVELGETPVEAVIREIKEETGLTASEFFLEAAGQTYSLNEDQIWHSFIFVCSQFSGELVPQPGEVEELKWVPLSELSEYNLFTPTKESIRVILLNRPELLYPNFEEVMKLTSLEQLVDIKNPGKNGGQGVIGGDGNWRYTKPGSTQNRPTKGSSTSRINSQIQQLKQSYINYFQNKSDFEVLYSINQGQFVFPDYSTAKQDGLVQDKKSYRLLFNEQFLHFMISRKK